MVITPADLALEIGVDETRAEHLFGAANALVEKYSSGAPDAIKREAVIRCSGWLAHQPAASIRSEETGDISTSYATASMSALRHSGAMALLSPWKVRRAGVIG